MKIIHFDNALRYEPEENWQRTSLCSEENISIEHFVKPPHHASPKHEHPNAQVLTVLEGSLSIFTDMDGEQVLKKGDTAYIPGNEPHVEKEKADKPSGGIHNHNPGNTGGYGLNPTTT